MLADAATIVGAGGSLAGNQHGPYRILSLLRAGGMGEVYRAHESKFGRDVAIKILPPELARDPQHLARFRRETHTLASLNHPNIRAIYGLKESADIRFLVFELVEGDTLRGPLTLVTELDRARQVANMRSIRVALQLSVLEKACCILPTNAACHFQSVWLLSA